jgi:hypothetical protein
MVKQRFQFAASLAWFQHPPPLFAPRGCSNQY